MLIYSLFCITVSSVLVVAMVVLALRIYIGRNVKYAIDDRIDGKTVVITGANTGIGRATAEEIARRGGRVILACRNKKKGDHVARKLRFVTGNAQIFCCQIDLASLASVEEFSKRFNSNEGRLDILINNAAYMGPKSFTVDSVERSFGVNYLGHFYLTYLLIEKLKASTPSKIINVLSDSYANATMDLSDIPLNDGYDIFAAYARSKMALVLFTLNLHRKYGGCGITTIGVHPGPVKTELMRNWPGVSGKLLRCLSKATFMRPCDGCQSIVHCAVSSQTINLAGCVVCNRERMSLTEKVKDKQLQYNLWSCSEKLCKII